MFFQSLSHTMFLDILTSVAFATNLFIFILCHIMFSDLGTNLFSDFVTNLLFRRCHKLYADVANAFALFLFSDVVTNYILSLTLSHTMCVFRCCHTLCVFRLCHKRCCFSRLCHKLCFHTSSRAMFSYGVTSLFSNTDTKLFSKRCHQLFLIACFAANYFSGIVTNYGFRLCHTLAFLSDVVMHYVF
jgi:hypothetical protein